MRLDHENWKWWHEQSLELELQATLVQATKAVFVFVRLKFAALKTQGEPQFERVAQYLSTRQQPGKMSSTKRNNDPKP